MHAPCQRIGGSCKSQVEQLPGPFFVCLGRLNTGAGVPAPTAASCSGVGAVVSSALSGSCWLALRRLCRCFRASFLSGFAFGWPGRAHSTLQKPRLLMHERQVPELQAKRALKVTTSECHPLSFRPIPWLGCCLHEGCLTSMSEPHALPMMDMKLSRILGTVNP